MNKLKLLTLLGLAFLSNTVQANEQQSDIVIANAWAKGHGANGAIYMDIHHNGDDHDVLKGATCSIARKCELHTHIKSGDVYQMRKVDSIQIAANEKTSLEHGGLHVMLIGLKEPLKPGDNIKVKLNFANAGEIEKNVVVKPIDHNPSDNKAGCACE